MRISGLGDLFRAKYLGTDVVTRREENLSLILEAEHPIVNDAIIKAKQEYRLAETFSVIHPPGARSHSLLRCSREAA